jgi:hypothetical protein
MLSPFELALDVHQKWQTYLTIHSTSEFALDIRGKMIDAFDKLLILIRFTFELALAFNQEWRMYFVIR